MTGYVHTDILDDESIRVEVDLEHVSRQDKFQFLDGLITALGITEEEWMVFVVARHEGIIGDMFGKQEVEQ